MKYNPTVQFAVKARVPPQDILTQLGSVKGWTMAASHLVEVANEADANWVRFNLHQDLATEIWTCFDPKVSQVPFLHRVDNAAVRLYASDITETFHLFGEQLSPFAHSEAIRANVHDDYAAFMHWLPNAPF